MFRDGRILGYVEEFFGVDFGFWLAAEVEHLVDPIPSIGHEQAHVDIQMDGGRYTFGLYWPHDPIAYPDFCGHLLTAVHECAHLFPFYALWRDGNPEVLFTATTVQHERYATFAEFLFADGYRHSFPLLATKLMDRLGPNGHPGEVVFDAVAAWRMGFNLRGGGLPLLGVDLASNRSYDAAS